ncbi:sodium/panthothenate symporter [Oceanobacillus oncorhynchi subsp. incaldanensis]|uniref:sodium/proline symporter n=1 Tax=Oceanobacillus oncorhynchi TaxID=545501 RepID=UPI001B00849C|nr:sodium/proline symporter [Oceanobacillus oncorhynchi]GIO18069.1 sodium/panthothenate symporter [Oceanobacillus oncorhynchi subsp. incaldanensis]
MYLTILIIYLVVTLSLGLLAARSDKSLEGYYVGGRSLGSGILALTWGATLLSSATYIGTAGYAYEHGWAGPIWGAGLMVFGGIFAWLTLGKKVRVISEKIGSLTIPNLFKKRYGSNIVSGFSSVLMFIFYIPIVASQFVAVGILFETIFGLPYLWGILIFGVITTLYTSFGGFSAVARTDAFQALLMIAGFFIITPIVISKVGGFSGLQQQLSNIDSGLLEPSGAVGHFTLLMIFSWFIYYLFSTGGQPFMLVRFFSAKNVNVLKWALPIGLFMMIWVYFNITILGLGARVLIPDLSSADSAFPALIELTLNPVFGGVIVAAIFAAMMSTVDSILHVVGTSVANDLFKQNLNKQASEKTMMLISKISVLLVGVLSFALAINPPGSVLELAAYGWTCLTSALFMPMLAGLYWKKFNKYGAIASMIGGGGMGAIAIGGLGGFALGFHPYILAFPTAVIAGIIVTLLTQNRNSEETRKINEVFFSKSNSNDKKESYEKIL